MSLDGLRAWIGEVERKLGKRTRVFLALCVIAIGIGGAAIYLAIDARNGAVSEADVRELQEELEAQISAGGGGGGADTAAVTQLESQVQALQAEVAQLREGKGGSSGKGTSGAGGGSAKSQEQLQELLDQAQGQGTTGK